MTLKSLKPMVPRMSTRIAKTAVQEKLLTSSEPKVSKMSSVTWKPVVNSSARGVGPTRSMKMEPKSEMEAGAVETNLEMAELRG